MSDRLNQTHRHRPAGAAPAPARPQARQSPPLASLQAAAGNRAVASAIQRAAGTAQLSKAPAPERATTSSTPDDLQITPVTEPEQQAAVDEVAEQKKKVSDASGARADAVAEVRNLTGTAIEARKKESDARDKAEALEREVGDAKRGERSSLEKARESTSEANAATKRQRSSLEEAGRHGETEKEKGAAAEEAASRRMGSRKRPRPPSRGGRTPRTWWPSSRQRSSRPGKVRRKPRQGCGGSRAGRRRPRRS